MRYPHTTREEADKTNLLEKGKGNFRIMKAEEKHNAKHGCDMAVLMLEVWDSKGTKGIIFDNILLNDMFAWKFRHLADSVGLTEHYDNQTLTIDMFLEKCGDIRIDIKKDKEGQWPDKNVVNDYLLPSTKKSNQINKEKVTSGVDDDDIPF